MNEEQENYEKQQQESITQLVTEMQIPQSAFHSLFLPLTASGTLWTTCPP
jgi:hypothetical protein